MLKKGLYRHHHEIEYAAGSVNAGDILLEVHETKNAFVLTLLEQQVRYDAPQIDDMFQKSNRVVIRKDGSKHAMSFCQGMNDWFCLYPYRVGVPFSFTHEDSIKHADPESTDITAEGEKNMSNSKQATAKKAPEVQASTTEAQASGAQESKPLSTKITVRAFPSTSEGNVLAGLTFDINGCFAVRGAKLVQGKNGPFVSMPQRQVRDGYQEVVFPITKEMRDAINNLAVSAYQLAMTEMTKKMEQTQAYAPSNASPEMAM